MENKIEVSDFCAVLDKFKENFNKQDEDGKKVYCEVLNEWLHELYCNDFFGTEGQLDPRGDHRNNY